eukprot:gene6907-7123_t
MDHLQSNSQVTLQQRVLEGLRIHETVGYNPAMQKEFAAIGGFKVLIDLLVDDWPDNSDFAASSSPADVVVKVPWSADPDMLEACVGPAFTALNRQRPLHRSLREAVEAIWRDGRIFRPDWFPQKLTECMRRYKYGLTTLQQQMHPDQGLDIAERLLYLAGNSCTNDNIRAMLNSYCSVPIIKTFRDNWQRKHEPVAGEPDPDRAEAERRRKEQHQQREWRSMPSSHEGMLQMAEDSISETASADVMNYSFSRYFTNTIKTADDEVMKQLNDAGAIAKIRVVAAHADRAHRTSVNLEYVLSRLLTVHESQVRMLSLRDVNAKAEDLAKAEQYRLQGNALFKEGKHSAAVDAWTTGLSLNPSSTLLYNNLSLVLLKMGRLHEAHDAAISGIYRDPSNAKAWVRLGEALRAVGRWQLAQLAYSAALDELKMKDATVEEWRKQTCANLARVWQFDEIPVPFSGTGVLSWLKLPPRPSSEFQQAAWSMQVEEGMDRMELSSRSLAVQLKVHVLFADAWRKAESGKLRSLPTGSAVFRVTWTQMPNRGWCSRRARFRLHAYIDRDVCPMDLILDGPPCSRDVLMFVAALCFGTAASNQQATKPELLMLDYR